MEQPHVAEPAVQFAVMREGGQLAEVVTTSSAINHFLQLVRRTRAYHTWVSYAHDLKAFFAVVRKPPEAVTRADCVAFIAHQDQAGHSSATVNRRLAAVSSLFRELQLLDPDRFRTNPIQPGPRHRRPREPRQSLYRRQAFRIPEVLTTDELRTFFAVLPTWRDRTLVLLLWISCLRVSEAVAIRFQDIECSQRRIAIAPSKGGHPRTVYMDESTFAALGRYLDTERRDLFPEVDAVFIAFKGPAHGRPLSVNALQHLIRYYAHACGLPQLHAHLFRHTGITQLIQQGMAEPAVRQFVGHHRPESLVPYLHLVDRYVAAEFDRVQGAFDWTHGLADALEGGNV